MSTARPTLVFVALSKKHARFVAEYLVDLNGTQAAIRAGYAKKSAKVQASRLLTNAAVKAGIEAAVAERASRTGITADIVLGELLRIARVDIRQAYDKSGHLKPIHDIPEDVARAISGVKVFDEFEGAGAERVKVGEVREVKLTDKVRALELLGKHLALFTDKVEHSVAKKTLEQLIEGSFGEEK